MLYYSQQLNDAKIVSQQVTTSASRIFALTVKIGVLVLSALGITNMWIAVFADVGVAILAILNAMRVGMKKYE